MVKIEMSFFSLLLIAAPVVWAQDARTETDTFTTEKIFGQRILCIAEAVELGQTYEAQALKKAVPLLERFEKAQEYNGINPSDWLVLRTGPEIVAISRAEFSIEGNFTARVVDPICQSHLDNMGVCNFQVSRPVANDIDDPVVPSGEYLFSKVKVRIVYVLPIDEPLSESTPVVYVLTSDAKLLPMIRGNPNADQSGQSD